MVIIFANEYAREYLLENGIVYSFRKGPVRKQLGKDWMTDKRTGKKIADVYIDAIEEIEPEMLYEKLNRYYMQSGFYSTDEWITIISSLNKWKLPRGWLYKVILVNG
jgi:hypothetical protein